MIRIFTLSFFILHIGLLVCAQTSADLLVLDQKILGASSQVYLKVDKQQPDRNDFKLATNILFATYRNLISTQDGSRCNFYPTCSAYCKKAIQKNGLILGTVQGIDRLTRCNGLSPHKYQIDMNRRKLIDHVH